MTEGQQDALLLALAEMVEQNCPYDEKWGYGTGFIGCHKAAMMLLVELGVMEELYNGYGRNYQAKFVVENDPVRSTLRTIYQDNVVVEDFTNARRRFCL